MTEEEAKTKWCPFARTAALVTETNYGTSHPAGPVANRWIAGPVGKTSERMTLCVGAGCMAWRWNEGWVSSAHDPVAGTMTTKLKDGARLQGGCGLAGAPQ